MIVILVHLSLIRSHDIVKLSPLIIQHVRHLTRLAASGLSTVTKISVYLCTKHSLNR